MDSLFGEGTSLPVRFFIAFVVVFALIGVTAWLIRRFGSGALSGAGARGRAPRLAVIEAGAVDGRRKLVLIRRDNVEHLIMIGGPTDIVVEANIVRGQNARDNVAPASSRTSSAAEALPRAVPLDDAAWLQPEPAARPTRAATRPAPLEDTTAWSLQPEQAPPPAPVAPAVPAAAKQRSRASDALAGLAAELNVRPAEPAVPTPPPPAPRAAPAVAAKPAAPAPAAAAADNNLADMASRLEAALKRPAPATAPRPAAPAPRAAPPVAATPAAPAKAPEAAPVVAPPVAEKAPEPAAAPEKQPDNVFGSIEEEMANLLGRPAGKPS
jgi:hypothetical protein